MAIKLHNKLPMELKKKREKENSNIDLKYIYWNTRTILYRSSYQNDSRISKNLL
jgi:hypothetical protein